MFQEERGGLSGWKGGGRGDMPAVPLCQSLHLMFPQLLQTNWDRNEHKIDRFLSKQDKNIRELSLV